MVRTEMSVGILVKEQGIKSTFHTFYQFSHTACVTNELKHTENNNGFLMGIPNDSSLYFYSITFRWAVYISLSKTENNRRGGISMQLVHVSSLCVVRIEGTYHNMTNMGLNVDEAPWRWLMQWSFVYISDKNDNSNCTNVYIVQICTLYAHIPWPY